MNKLIVGTMVIGCLTCLSVFGAESVKPSAATEAPKKMERPSFKQMTPEQRAELKAKREKFIAERKARIQARQLEILKKHGIEGEKAQAILDDLQKALREDLPFGMGRNGFKRQRGQKKAIPAAEKPAAEKK